MKKPICRNCHRRATLTKGVCRDCTRQLLAYKVEEQRQDARAMSRWFGRRTG